MYATTRASGIAMDEDNLDSVIKIRSDVLFLKLSIEIVEMVRSSAVLPPPFIASCVGSGGGRGCPRS